MKRLPYFKFYLPLVVILAIFLAAKVFLLFRYHAPGWDESVYLGMGKYIYSLGSSGLWETIRPAGLPAIIGPVWKLGLPYVFFSEVITVLFGIGTIMVCYLTANKLFNRKVAILAAALLATSPWFYLYSSYILTEVPSTFFALLAIYCFIRRGYFLSGASAAAAMLLKFPNGLVLVAIAAILIATTVIKKQLLQKLQLLPLVKVLLAFVFVALPFFIFNYLFYRPFTSNAYDAIFRPLILGAWHQFNPAKAMASQLYSYSFYLVEAFKQHFAFVMAVAAVFLFFKRKWFNDSGKLLLAMALALYFAYFSYIPNKDSRFLILFLPALCIFIGAAFFEVFAYFQRRLISPARSFALVALVALFALSFLVALYKDYSFYSWRPSSEPVVVQELYHSISRLGITGPVLTSEPVFAAYNDNLFLAYYDTSSGIPTGLRPSWDLFGMPSEAVIFSPQSFYCAFGDLACYNDMEELHKLIASNFVPVFNGTYYDGQLSYYIFVNESVYSGSKK